MREKLNSIFFPHDEKADHFKALDGLRGIAVLMVLLSHSSNLKLFFHDLLNFQRVGKVGVYLFFVLSAYLLDRQIADGFVKKKISLLFWKNYFLRRFLRIYPLFTIALIVYGLINFLGLPTVIDKKIDIILHMLLVKGESIFWSIPVEFKYYFLSPLIIWFCFKVLNWNIKRISLFLITLILLTVATEYYYRLTIISTMKYLPIFLVGTYISIYEIIMPSAKFFQSKGILNILGIVSVLLIGISIPFYFQILFSTKIDFHDSIYYLPYGLCWGLLLISVKYGSKWVKFFFELKALRFIGTISFSMYLFHMPILHFVKSTDFFPKDLKIYLFFGLALVVSSISYFLIEKPLSKIKIKY